MNSKIKQLERKYRRITRKAGKFVVFRYVTADGRYIDEKRNPFDKVKVALIEKENEEIKNNGGTIFHEVSPR